jgi:hypothetical protein
LIVGATLLAPAAADAATGAYPRLESTLEFFVLDAREN